MKLSSLIQSYRISNRVTVRAMAKDIGIEPTALFRFEQGKSISNDKWVKVMMWVLREGK